MSLYKKHFIDNILRDCLLQIPHSHFYPLQCHRRCFSHGTPKMKWCIFPGRNLKIPPRIIGDGIYCLWMWHLFCFINRSPSLTHYYMGWMASFNCPPLCTFIYQVHNFSHGSVMNWRRIQSDISEWHQLQRHPIRGYLCSSTHWKTSVWNFFPPLTLGCSWNVSCLIFSLKL